MIVIYTSNSCSSCLKAKEFMKDKGIEFQERNVEYPEHREELLSISGQMSVPVININGNIIVGFSPKRILENIC